MIAPFLKETKRERLVDFNNIFFIFLYIFFLIFISATDDNFQKIKVSSTQIYEIQEFSDNFIIFHVFKFSIFSFLFSQKWKSIWFLQFSLKFLIKLLKFPRPMSLLSRSSLMNVECRSRSTQSGEKTKRQAKNINLLS